MLFVPTLFPRVPHLPMIQGSRPYVYGIGGRVVERCRRGTCVAPDAPAGQRQAEVRGVLLEPGTLLRMEAAWRVTANGRFPARRSEQGVPAVDPKRKSLSLCQL